MNAQATVTCAVPGAPAAAAPAIAAPRTGQGPADAFAIRPPNTGDAGLAAGSSSNAMVYVAAGVAVFALAGLASLKFATRRNSDRQSSESSRGGPSQDGPPLLCCSRALNRTGLRYASTS